MIDAGPTRSGVDMSSQERPLRMAIYAAMLSIGAHSPLPTKSGDEEARIEKSSDNDKPVKPTRVDSGLSQRFVPIPVAERNYERLVVGSDGALFYIAHPQAGSSLEPPGSDGNADGDLYRFDFQEH
jgi:tricorn protease